MLAYINITMICNCPCQFLRRETWVRVSLVLALITALSLGYDSSNEGSSRVPKETVVV